MFQSKLTRGQKFSLGDGNLSFVSAQTYELVECEDGDRGDEECPENRRLYKDT